MIPYILGGAGAAILALGLWINVLMNRMEDLREKYTAAQQTTTVLRGAAEKNRTALDECRVINAQNALLVLETLERAEAAEQRVKILEDESNATITIIQEQSDEFRERVDTACRTMDEPLPGDFVDWVFNDQ